ncbi:MAG TPA: SRPBCC domain-containing protein [Candidatus Limnocylindrales bacterium]|nr:SRPBCC domain-containing protein [Candidatus Limnocylindrales bacterium]
MGDETGTERLLGTKLIAAGEARTAVLRRTFAAPIDDLWSAITDPARLRSWFTAPRGDLRLGGTYALEASGHGRILRCDAPRMLRVTWSTGPGHPDEVEVRLSKADGGGTVLELEHASLAMTAADGVTDAILGVGMGWELAMAWLERYVTGDGQPRAPGRTGEAALQPTAEDRAGLTESARAWTALIEPSGSLSASSKPGDRRAP